MSKCCNFQFDYGRSVTYACTRESGHDGPCMYAPVGDIEVGQRLFGEVLREKGAKR